jgi:acyl-CoA dehydrogenase
VQLLVTAAPEGEQLKDLDFLLSVGELFTLIVYGQLILEQAQILGLETDVVDTIFGVLIRDFSAGAVSLHGKTGSTEAQQQWALGAVRKPVVDAELFDRVWAQVVGLSDAYSMNP